MTMAIRTCFFDMGNVLVHFSHEKMCRNLSEVCGLSYEQVRKWLLEDGQQWRLERGEISERQFCDELEACCGRTLSLTEVCHAAADIFWLNESIVPVLQQLKDKGLRLVLLSNTSQTHLQFIEQNFDVLKLMDDRVTSFEVGALKPDEEIFRSALQKAGCAADECFYTDDIAAYIQQASRFGIHARLYTTTEKLLQELQELNVLPGSGR
jgi:glucose-1-phosphatase